MVASTRHFRGWDLGRGLDQRLTLAALRPAMRRGRRPEVHHSDQWGTVCRHGIHRLAGRPRCGGQHGGRRQAGGERVCCALIRTIRGQEINLSEYRDFADAYGQLGRFLDNVYNRKRIHPSLGYLTPAAFEPQGLRGAERNGQVMNGQPHRRLSVSVHSAVRVPLRVIPNRLGH
jgi:putative transposase